MKKIIIFIWRIRNEYFSIRNGFDIAHELKTTYKDFLEYCKENKMSDKQYCQNLWLKHFINTKINNTWIDFEKEIYSVLTFIIQNNLIRQLKKNSIMLEFKNESSRFDLRDINKFLRVIPTKTFSQEHYEYQEDNGVYTESLKVDIENEEGFANFLYDQLRRFTKLFEDYLLNLDVPSNKYKLSLKSIGANEGDDDVYVVSFNYTDTCEKFYTTKFAKYAHIDSFKPIYVHGNAVPNKNYKDCKLVLGTQSFNTPKHQDEYNIPVCFNIFQKHNQRHKYGTIEPYQNFIRTLIDISENVKNIIPIFHVIGHSLDETDHNVLEHIFNVNKKSIINIYFHNELAQENLINNITHIIGEQEVMTRVRFIHQHNESRSILKENK